MGQAATWMADELKRCVEHGEKHGVLIGRQNHGGMLSNADEMLTLVRMVDSKWLGLIIDTGWLTGPDPYADIARVIPYAVNWQVKEFLNGGKGPQTDLTRLARLIRDSGYRGHVPLETLNSPGKADSHLPFRHSWKSGGRPSWRSFPHRIDGALAGDCRHLAFPGPVPSSKQRRI